MPETLSIRKQRIDENKAILYKKYTVELLDTIIKFYAGDDVVTETEEFSNYYKWCFNRTSNSFNMNNNINFGRNKRLFKYFYVYYYNEFFLKQDKDLKKIRTRDANLWEIIFSADKNESKGFTVVLDELYEIFSKTR